jgi:hypothetical protein
MEGWETVEIGKIALVLSGVACVAFWYVFDIIYQPIFKKRLYGQIWRSVFGRIQLACSLFGWSAIQKRKSPRASWLVGFDYLAIR